MYLLIFEFLGTQEFILILLAALILFGPRKLPQLARSMGQSLAEFKRASEDFKKQWEREVEHEASGLRSDANSIMSPSSWEAVKSSAPEPDAAPSVEPPATPEAEPVPVLAAAAAPSVAETPAALPLSEEKPVPEPTSKRDWY